MNIQPGDRVECMTAHGDWITGTALSSVEGTHEGRKKIHDFPVIWVTFQTHPREPGVPWPASYVRPARKREEE